MYYENDDKCIECGGTPESELRLVYSSCRKCYEESAKALIEYKLSRKETYPEINKIEDNLYLGNEDAAIDKDLLKSKGITHVLAVGNFLQMRFPDDFSYDNIKIDDSPKQDMSQFFKRALKFIKSGKVTYVHCSAGVSRSSTIVIAYIMYEKKMSFEAAYKYVKAKRSVILPNKGFKMQLEEFEKKLLDGTFKLDED